MDTDVKSTVTESESIDRIPTNGDENNKPEFSFNEQSTTTPKRGRGRPRKDNTNSTTNPTSKTSSKKSEKQVKEYTDKVISFIEQSSSLLMKQDTSFNPTERTMIEPALSDLIERMDINALDKVSKFTSPLFLIAGLGMWISRLNAEKQLIIMREKLSNDAPNNRNGFNTETTQNGYSPSGFAP